MPRSSWIAAWIAGALSVSVMTTGASADNIVLNQWYTGAFAMPSPSPLTGGVNDGFLGTDGPVLPGGFADAVLAPATPWVITLSHYGTLTVTDVEASGDFFQMFDNEPANESRAQPIHRRRPESGSGGATERLHLGPHDRRAF
jgi:hypothetical protein